MSYVDALYLKDKDVIKVVERVDGQRIYKDYPAEYVMYYDDPKGKCRTIYDTAVTKYQTNSHKEFMKAQRIHSNKRLWESDFKPVNRLLENHYVGLPSPKLHTAFLDIEVDFETWAYKFDHPVKIRDGNETKSLSMDEFREHPLITKIDAFDPELEKWIRADQSKYMKRGRGYAPTTDTFNEITAISVYLDWSDQLITMAVPPKTLSFDDALKITDQFENCFLFRTESEMLEVFLQVIEDADVYSGWNSEPYDMPYIVGRVVATLGKDALKKLCLWGASPQKKMIERFGTEILTYNFMGRVHLDYMQLYRKYTFEERHSYSLDSIGEYEGVGNKIAYDGTLDDLYNKDFYTFIDYNRQDTFLVHKLDRKLKFIDIANALAHDNTVLLPATMGAVAVTDQAIVNESHRRDMVVPNRQHHSEEETATADKAAGAYVAHPKKGIHRDIGAIDINSLYPSTLRALNMSPETIVGQIRPESTDEYIATKMKEGSTFADAWEDMFGTFEYRMVMDKTDDELKIDWEGGQTDVVTAKEAHRIIFEMGEKWTLSANGTIFSTEDTGIIPGLLAGWYAARKVMQKELEMIPQLKDGIPLPKELLEQINILLNQCPHAKFTNHTNILI